MMPKKDDLIQQLHDVVTFLRILGENEFKVRAFDKAATTLQSETLSLDMISNGSVKIPGIGDGLKKEIRSFLESGRMDLHRELSDKIPQGVLELMNIPGVGPKKAFQLVDDLKISSIGELEYCCRENRLLHIKGFGQKAQDKILQSIEEIKNRSGKLRLEDVFDWVENLKASLNKKFDTLKIIDVGAYGRRLDILERIDLLFVVPDDLQKKIITFINKEGEELKRNVLKTPIGLPLHYSFLNKIPTGVNLLENYYVDRNQSLPKDFSDWEPTWFEPEWLDTNRKPNSKTYRIKVHGKVKGFFHCHTTASDGQNSLEEMVREAERLGFEYIGISDHSKSAFYAGGLKEEQILQQREDVKKLQKKVKIKIFQGIESDILQNGELDYEDSVLKKFDFVVGSIHSRFQMDKPNMTMRLENALQNKRITMWGHPTGRLLLSRKGYEADWTRCFEVMSKNKVILELNCNPQRLDADWRWGKMVEENKLMISINPDAHSIRGIADLQYGYWMAEKMMIPFHQILNLKNADEVEEYLEKRKT